MTHFSFTLDLLWKPPEQDDDIVAYRISMDDTVLAETPASVRDVTVTGMAADPARNL